ncbi:MAG TPA: hypothetical protein VFQ58_09255, partial [Flavisolibacter sp.]|nr:hypothetical protein [Flavisolibacter sp.]
LLPDVTLEVVLNKTGSIKATFFYRENIDYLYGTTSGSLSTKRFGTSLSYGREFDNIGELLNKKKARKKRPLPIPPPITDSSSTR